MATPKDENGPERMAYSINEFAEAGNISRPTVYRMIKAGELRTVKIRAHHRIPVSEAHRIFGVEAA